MFIVFEGTDGSGTSTQAKKLVSSLLDLGTPVFHTVEPSSSCAGVLLREILTHKKTISSSAMQLLFFADRIHHLESEIIPALSSGKTVIVERYNWSTLAYGSASGVDISFLKSIAQTLLIPDITFFLDLPVEISLERIKKRGIPQEHFETKNILDSVYSVMNELSNSSFGTQKSIKIDAKKTIDEVANSIFDFYKKQKNIRM